MQLVHTIEDLRAALRPFHSPVFVPTMGNLHDGHLALVRTGKPLGDVTVSSIFVNRLQFAPHEDFDTYPRTLQADCTRLEQAGCDIVFAPSEKELYPEPQVYKVQPPSDLADILEGHFRPGFFIGVCTVVMKLFQCVFSDAKGPRYALFGKKDYQQQMVIRRMVQQFAMPIEVIAGETQRAADGLALSSRNGYLNETERAEAVQLSLALRALARDALSAGHALPQRRETLENQAMRLLALRGWGPDYLTVRRRADLQPPTAQDATTPDSLVVLGAARLGSTRLIDNFEI
ncbi:MAG: Pantothenate synthetase [Pseudomonadota bacterium]|jgi:pantoate--beta-alanine ligase